MTRAEMLEMLKLFIQALQNDENGTINTPPAQIPADDIIF